MPIIFQSEENIFHLQANNTSYVMQILNGMPVHVYWGKRLRRGNRFSDIVKLEKPSYIDRLPQEYPQYGTGDFRSPAYHIQLGEDGSRVSKLVYQGFHLYKGKPPLKGLPSVYVENDDEAETLELQLKDELTGLLVCLNYTLFKNFDAIARSVHFSNKGEKEIYLLRALSAAVDFPDADFEMLYLSGAWSRETYIQRRALHPGMSSIDSKRGTSSHQHNPFLSLVRPNTDENQGDTYGFSLVYSGNFLAETEVDQFSQTRVSIGINPFDFKWKLKPGHDFQTPEAVMVYTDQGIGGMSRIFHKLYRMRLARGTFRDKERPILVNSWEGTYFKFTEEKLLKIADTAAALGIELFVLDDGWFGKRDDDTTSLGDWYENQKKLPSGLKGLAEKINRLGLKFGLWVEPEMISPKSNLYKKHPDWCIHVKGRKRTELRNQLVLDITRKEVRDFIVDTFSGIFSKAPISYVKWDMNRYLTEIGTPDLHPDRQMETAHRYVLGLYEILEKLTRKFPHILFENCSSGGGRFDPGMLYYMPQTWASDNTDAIQRLKIQYGASLVYPASAMGAHVSAVPNHQVGRTTPLSTRGNAAMSANFGYEMDLTQLTAEEKDTFKHQVNTYKSIRNLVQFGNMYRLKSPFEGNEASWMFVSENKNEAVVFYFRILAESNIIQKRLLLDGLDTNKDYRVEGRKEIYGGDLLMNIGLPIYAKNRDFHSFMIKLTAVK